MPDDIAKALAYQVKREIAAKYFGTRKAIEGDIEAFKNALAKADAFYNEKIGADFARIYDILSERSLVDLFARAIGLSGRIPFYPEYKSGGLQIKEWPQERGWTVFSRLLNRLKDSYLWLHRDMMRYQDMLNDLKDEALVIKEEIKGFQDKFALDEIIGFINALDRDELSNVLGENLRGDEIEALNANLYIQGPPEPEEALEKALDLPAPDKIKGILKELVQQVYNNKNMGNDPL
ncbi:MAG: hypothetical protein ACP5J5_04980 [Dissulfurimicrobium sp.]|uniref:hypothetical protein n=1 Tax=Dissulfurimicrobium TaxID=1769732 RepID=UPI001EDC2B8A|nr:hypothetical protein [Dissulfurimicrobium hydrothermale]UKL12873.1 hypothetical protein LGS26_05095 [Dissulfurimicrobium hydrothermale]